MQVINGDGIWCILAMVCFQLHALPMMLRGPSLQRLSSLWSPKDLKEIESQMGETLQESALSVSVQGLICAVETQLDPTLKL